MKTAVLLISALALGACDHAKGPDPMPTSQTEPPHERWKDTFVAYPGARLLCSEHVAGREMHIDWTSYATSDDPARVSAFYEKNLGAATIHRESGFSLRVGENLVLDVAAATGDFPKCEKAPAAGDKTVIVVSQAIR